MWIPFAWGFETCRTTRLISLEFAFCLRSPYANLGDFDEWFTRCHFLTGAEKCIMSLWFLCRITQGTATDTFIKMKQNNEFNLFLTKTRLQMVMKKRWKLGQTDRYEQMIVISIFFSFIFIPHADKHLIDICVFIAWKQSNETDSCAAYWNLWLLQNTKQLLQILFKSLFEWNYCPAWYPNKLYDSTVLNIKYYCSSSFLSTWTSTCSRCLSKLQIFRHCILLACIWQLQAWRRLHFSLRESYFLLAAMISMYTQHQPQAAQDKKQEDIFFIMYRSRHKHYKRATLLKYLN